MPSMGNITSTRALFAVLILALASGCASSRSTMREQVFKPPLDRMVVSSGFGTRRGKPHYGIDLPAKRGTAVHATASGTVSFAGRQKGFGRVVIVQHVDGYESYYAHLSKITVRKGKKVTAGDRVGKVGKSGKATGPHLHFEIRKKGRPLNPSRILGHSPAELAP